MMLDCVQIEHSGSTVAFSARGLVSKLAILLTLVSGMMMIKVVLANGVAYHRCWSTLRCFARHFKRTLVENARWIRVFSQVHFLEQDNLKIIIKKNVGLFLTSCFCWKSAPQKCGQGNDRAETGVPVWLWRHGHRKLSLLQHQNYLSIMK